MASFGYNFRVAVDQGDYSRRAAELTDTPRLLTGGPDETIFNSGDELSTDGLPTLVFYGPFSRTDGEATHTFLVLGDNADGSVYWLFGKLPGLTLDEILNVLPPAEFGIDAVTYTVCFAPGTLIATPDGERAVETLAPGDLVLTTDGRAVPVRWMGRQTKHKALTRERDFAPVRVRTGALGPGVPHSDLTLTGDHALIVDGLAINASALVNGTTISFVPLGELPETVTYWHIETAAHEEVLANGAAAETFVDYVTRRSFDNHQEYLDLHGVEHLIPEMRRPRISSRRQLPAAIAARLNVPSFGTAVAQDHADLMRRLSA